MWKSCFGTSCLFRLLIWSDYWWHFSATSFCIGLKVILTTSTIRCLSFCVTASDYYADMDFDKYFYSGWFFNKNKAGIDNWNLCLHSISFRKIIFSAYSDDIPSMKFYGSIKTLTRKVRLKDASALKVT